MYTVQAFLCNCVCNYWSQHPPPNPNTTWSHHTLQYSPCLLCVISVMAAFCVQWEIYQQQQQQLDCQQLSSPLPGQVVQYDMAGVVRPAHHSTNHCPATPSSLPAIGSAGRRAVLGRFSTSFGLCGCINCIYTKTYTVSGNRVRGQHCGKILLDPLAGKF